MSGIFPKLSVCQKISRGISGSRFLHKKPIVKPSTVIERTSQKLNYFDMTTLYQLDKAYCLSPTRFSLDSLLQMKKTSSSLPRLRQELLVRLAHLQMFLFSVNTGSGPAHALMEQESFLQLLQLQTQNFRDAMFLIRSTQPSHRGDKGRDNCDNTENFN